MNDKAKANIYDLEEEKVEITVRGKVHTFTVRELSAGRLSELTANLNHQDDAKRSKAQKEFTAMLISSCVTDDDGNSISFDDAQRLRVVIMKKLESVITRMNALDASTVEEGIKNV